MVAFRPGGSCASGLERDGGERFRRLQLGVGVDAGDHVLALHFAGRREEVVLAHRLVHVAGGNPIGRELHRVQPEAHGEHLVAEDFRFGHARQRRQLGLDDPRQVVGDLRVAQLVAVEADVHQRGGVGRLLVQHWVLGILRQLVLHRVGLAQQLGVEAIGVGTDARIDRDHRGVLLADRGHVVDAFGAGQTLLQRLGDVALDGLGVGAGVRGGHRDQRTFHLWVLTDGQAVEGLDAEQHDQQADDARQHGAADEGVGERHGKSLEPCLSLLCVGPAA